MFYLLFLDCKMLIRLVLTPACQVAAENIVILNSVNHALPFQVTTADDAKDIITEEIRLR